MKIYTKNGDNGETQLLGGAKVSKDNLRLQCYGCIDELNAYIGHIYDHKVDEKTNKFILAIQNKLLKVLEQKFEIKENFYKIENKDGLIQYLTNVNPKKTLTIKEKNNVMMLCKHIIQYCKTNYDLDYTK